MKIKYEIRKVPLSGYSLSFDESGKVIPMFNKSFQQACEDWDFKAKQWQDHQTPYVGKDMFEKYPNYSEWAGERPSDPRRYLPDIDDEVGYQVFEVFSDGSGIPVSSIYPNEDIYFERFFVK